MTKYLTLLVHRIFSILLFIGLAFWSCENNDSVNNQLCCDELSFDGTWRRDSIFSYFDDDSGMIETTQKDFDEFSNDTLKSYYQEDSCISPHISILPSAYKVIDTLDNRTFRLEIEYLMDLSQFLGGVDSIRIDTIKRTLRFKDNQLLEMNIYHSDTYLGDSIWCIYNKVSPLRSEDMCVY